MSGLERNSQCPCMSGKKFKKCCGTTGVWEALKEQGLNYFNESYMLEIVLNSDPVFYNYYINERGKINKPVFFVQTPHMQSAASFGNLGDEAYIIVSKHSKYPLEDSIHVAHEIQHLVFWANGYKLISNKNSNREHKFINDLIYDPLINQVLHKYGFDILSYLKLQDKIQTQISDINIANNNLLVSTLIVKRFLDYRNINPDIKFEDTYYFKWANENFPTVIPLGYKILDVIEMNGLNSPEKCEIVLRNLIDLIDRPDLFKKIEII